MSPDPERLLTPAELDLMRVVWARGPSSVQEVVDALADDRAYTTVATLLKILEQKGFLTTRREGRRHVYAPATPRPAYEARSVRSLLDRVFDGDAAALVRRLVGSEGVDAEELAEIRRVLDEAGRR